MTTTGQSTPAGWYPDPSDQRRLRWFDGAQWSDQVHEPQPAPVAAPDAAYAAPAAPAYTAPAYGQAPVEQAYAPGGDGCQVCGATPARKTHLRGHQGMLLLMRFFTYRGQYCRDCGTARFREVQSRTMLVGWWGYISFVVNSYNVFHNMNQLRLLQALGAPKDRVRAAKPMPASVFSSPGFYVTLCVPVLVVLVVVRLGNGG